MADAKREAQGGDGSDNGRCEFQLHGRGRNRIYSTRMLCSEINKTADVLLWMQPKTEDKRGKMIEG